VWFAIWTARNQKGEPPLTAIDGVQDSVAMAARLPYYQYDKTLPVFYDIEPGIYDLDPAGAEAAIGAWKAGMHRVGYPYAYVYTIKRQGGDWIADWTNEIPASIPPGKVGVQYGGDQGSFDYDVFIDELLTGDPAPIPPPPPSEDSEMKAFLIHVPSTPPSWWVVTADLTARKEVSEDSYVALKGTGQYLTNPGIDQATFAGIPVVAAS